MNYAIVQTAQTQLMAQTRGERNHNPLNIRRSDGTRWLGQCPKQHDREFVQFQSDLFGFRAAFRILRTYFRLQNIDTLRGIIYRWAPPEDGNNTESYIATVSRWTNIAPNKHLTFEDKEALVAIVAAMAQVESHVMIVDTDILRKAYELAK